MTAAERMAEYRRVNPEKAKAAQRRSYQKNRAHYMAKSLKNKDPFKHRVRSLVGAALSRGVLVKGDCELCGTEERIEAHHPDYTKPLEVQWLCISHHRQLHADLKFLQEVK